MKTQISLLLFALFLNVLSVDTYAQEKLEKVFASPPDDAHVGLYWYWMNGNISKEGVIADIQAMGEVGVKWVYLMDIGLHPAGKVNNRSKEWYDMVATALEEAKKHNIKIHIASPGWAVSGGPWVTTELSMKELVWTDTHVVGGKKISLTLDQPATKRGFYRDIAILAFPAQKGDTWGSIRTLNPTVKDNQGNPVENAKAMFDGSYDTKVITTNSFSIEFTHPQEIRSLLLRAAKENGSFKAKVEGWDSNSDKYVELGNFEPTNPGPFSALIGDITFPTFTSDKFRITLSGSRAVIEELALYGSTRMSDWSKKAGFGVVDVTSKSTDPTHYPAISPKDIVSPESIINLTAKMTTDGKLTWDVPAGEWTIQRFGYTSTGIEIFPAPTGGAGLEIDKLNKAATDYHYKHTVKTLLDEVGSELAKNIAFHHIDSYEAGWMNWTEGFDKEFSDRRGYDLIQFLPAMTGRIVENTDKTEKFYWDLRNVIGDMFIDNHYGRMAENGKKDGLKFSNEPYGGPFNSLKLGSIIDLPMVEFWIPSTQPLERKINFQGVFAGRTNGRKVIASETYTSEASSERWNHHPYNLKATGDYVYCSGVNRFIMHVSAHQPFVNDHLRPGLTCGINGIHYDRNNTWWYNGGKKWNEYLARCQAMLQEGEHVADVLYLQGSEVPSESRWFEPELPIGYDLDACDENIFLQLTVVDSCAVLPSGKSYRYVVLPAHGWLTNAALIKTEELIRSGATVIGSPTKETPSLSDALKGNGERDDTFKKLWSSENQLPETKRYGKGRLIQGKTFQEILNEDKLIPDFSYDKSSGLLINYIHRTSEDNDHYFVANGKAQDGWVTCRFRVNKSMVPQFWYPDKGTIEKCGFYKRGQGYVEIPIHFDPTGSVFVVFKKSVDKENPIVSVTRNGEEINQQEVTPKRNDSIRDNFTVSFWCKPSANIEMPREADKGVAWSGKRWAVSPKQEYPLYGTGESKSGVSAGKNGIVIFERWEDNVTPMLVYPFETNNSDWYHVTVVYENGTPSLYINGAFATEGLKSGKHVHTCTFDDKDQNKTYIGHLREVQEFAQSLTAKDVVLLFDKSSKPIQTEADMISPVMFKQNNEAYTCEFYQTGNYTFTKANGTTQPVKIKNIATPLVIDSKWNLHFPSGWGTPETLEMDKLISLSEHPNDEVKHFSGTVGYTTKFNLSPKMFHPNKTLYLDLGEVNVIAEIIVNGKNAGIYWKPPFRIDITALAKPGINNLEIKVTNLWGNRMIGDEQYPSDIEYGRGGMIKEWPEWLLNNQPRPEPKRQTFSAIKAWNKDDLLPPSGLVGPVTIKFIETIKIK